jgi:predicted transcriptional regulator
MSSPSRRCTQSLSEKNVEALEAIFIHGPSTTKELELILGVGKTQVHKHVVKLRSDGLIQGRRLGDRKGRPPFVFSVTDDGLKVLEEFGEKRLSEAAQKAELLSQLREVRRKALRLA